MRLSELSRLAQTIRPLKPSQLYWRSKYMLARKLPLRQPPIKRRSTPAVLASITERRQAFDSVPLFHAMQRPAEVVIDEMSQGIFNQLNQQEWIGFENPDWKLGPCVHGRLWTITLHYHAWAYELAEIVAGQSQLSQQAETLLVHYLKDWLNNCSQHAPGSRALAWNAFACSTRIAWWIRIYQLLETTFWQRHPELQQHFLASLSEQAEFVATYLERDLRGNHLLRNAVGLAWAARFFDGLESQQWAETAREISIEQLNEQVLADGGHFERSPMYHIHIMEDVLSLALLLEDPAANEQARNTWQRMATYLQWTRHPDGEIPLFNDAALNAVTPVGNMLELGSHLNVETSINAKQGGCYFPQSGMAVWHGQPWSLFFDVGEVGPDVQPGHSHADTLTMECSYAGQRLIVDTGTFAYDKDESRAYDRSTAAHNTVCIDGGNSSDVWDIFRLGRRAKPRDVLVKLFDHRMTVAASHDGYSHLPGHPGHTRTIHVANESKLKIVDMVTSNGSPHSIAGGFLIHPQWKVCPTPSGWRLTSDNNTVAVTIHANTEISKQLEQRAYHPEYGRTENANWIGWNGTSSDKLEVAITFESA